MTMFTSRSDRCTLHCGSSLLSCVMWQQELDLLKATFPKGQVLDDCGLQAPQGGGVAGRTVLAAAQIPTHAQVLEFVQKHATDRTSTFFRPHVYKKAGVYAKQVLAGENLKIGVVSGQTLEPPEFVFVAPWGATCQVSRNDYLALLVSDSSSQLQRKESECYRVDGGAFRDRKCGVRRYYRICGKCRRRVDDDCRCSPKDNEYVFASGPY